MPALVVRALPLNDVWRPFGTDRRRGVFVENFQCTQDVWGPLDASWTLHRTPKVRWPDLDFWTPFEVELENNMVWAGRQTSAPGSDDDESIQVTAQGWQSAADDRPFSRDFVHANLSDFVDVRTLPSAQLGQGAGFHPASCQVASDTSGITLMFAGNTGGSPAPTVGGFEGCSVQLDMGPANVAVRVVADIDTSNNASTAVQCFGFISDDPRPQQGHSSTLFGVNLNAASYTNLGSGVTAAPAGRYVSIRMQVAASPVTPTADIWVKIKRILVFTAPVFESGGVSTLTATDVVKDALARLTPIGSSTGYIAQTSFVIPAFTMSQQTPRDAINAANAFQDWQARIRADSPAGSTIPTMEYRAKPTSPAYALTDLAAFDDTSSGSGDQVYNEVTYTGTGPDGAPVLVTRTAAAAGLPATIPDRRGVTRGYTIQSDAALTATAAQQLCDVFLSQRNTQPFKGTIHATSPRSVQILPSGANCPPWQLLRAPGELVNFKHLQNPDTGTLGRDGRIAKASYTYATNSTELDIDSTAGSLEALQARLAVVTAR